MLSADDIQKLIQDKFQSFTIDGQPIELYAPISYTLEKRGKRIRPQLLLMACDLFGGDVKNALDTAIGLELFHNFTLIHDDIMDNAPLRRGRKTVFKKWNANIAILSGDTMFALAYKQVIKTDSPHLKKILEVFTKTAIEVCEGQQLDLNFESMNNIAIFDYLEMIRLKTAVLIGASLKIGALFAGAKADDAELIYKFGENIGMAFQLKDDYLDTFGDENKFGKKSGGDIVTNKKTYLYLKAIEMANEQNRNTLIDLYKMNSQQIDSYQKINQVKSIFVQLKVDDYIEKEMQIYFQDALLYLNKIKSDKNKKEVLLNFASVLMERNI